jgi:hypothetical protein
MSLCVTQGGKIATGAGPPAGRILMASVDSTPEVAGLDVSETIRGPDIMG